MTAIVITNSIAAVVVVSGLAAAMRLGHLTAGGRFERVLRRVELRRCVATAAEEQTELRRAA